MKKKTKKKPRIKAGRRGFKLCEACYSENGVRARHCKHCNHEFPKPQPRLNFKRKRAKTEKINWKELKQGDKIRVLNGGGTTFKGVENVYNIVRRGIYIVQRLDNEGIHCFSKEGTGHNYIFMGKEKVNKAGFLNKAHKIRKVISND